MFKEWNGELREGWDRFLSKRVANVGGCCTLLNHGKLTLVCHLKTYGKTGRHKTKHL